uniref:ATP synthase subunit a n=1 Tax=Ichneutes sp. QL-2013 TaxID=1421596 RepID=A0A0A6ZKT5_9HYME|nr:ATP synthase F0 subunit 6 [Ichneutes sp. QL-2013]
MLNLFSIFDPSTYWFSLNWLSVVLILLFIPQIYWLNSCRYIYMFMVLMKMLFNEFKIILNSNFNISNCLYFMSLFIFIMLNNFMGLFPYVFTGSAHMVFAILFSLSMWISLMFFGWFLNTKFMLIHLVPMGTPFFLMFFMVLIESLSNFIRPLTLGVRLVANMVAGHLLLTLLSMFIMPFPLYFIMLILQIMLLILEISVSLIQSYVYVILMILYLKETN